MHQVNFHNFMFLTLQELWELSQFYSTVSSIPSLMIKSNLSIELEPRIPYLKMENLIIYKNKLIIRKLCPWILQVSKLEVGELGGYEIE